MRWSLLATMVIGCAPSDPCGSMTVAECADAARDAVSAEERLELAAWTCELGSPSGCSTLGLQLLLDSDDNDSRRALAYRAFRRSCSSDVPYLCLYPSFVEINRPAPNRDLVVNGFKAHCDAREEDSCLFATAAKQRLGLSVTPQALAEFEAVNTAIPDFDFFEELALNGTWGPQIRSLPTLPTNTTGNLWTYGMDDDGHSVVP